MREPPLRRLWRYTHAHRARVWAATTCSVLNKFFDLAPPVLIGMAVDLVVKGQESLLARAGFTTPDSQLFALGGLTLAVWALESVFEYAYQWLWRNLAQTVQHELRTDAYAHLQGLDQAWFDDASGGRLLAILNDDVNQLERFLDGGANDLLQVATTVVLISAAYFWLSPVIALISVAPIPFILLGSFRFQARIAPRYADVRERASQLNAQLANNLAGMETIKSFTAEDHEVERARRLSDDYRRANRKAIALSSAFSPLIRMVIVVGFVGTLVYGGRMALAGELGVGAYSVMVFLTQRLLWPLTRLGTTVDLYHRAMASTDRVLDLLDTRPTLVDGEAPLPVEAARGDIVFEGVSFSYPGREPVLRDFSWRIPAGSTVAVVGPTGAGKSTLVRLLLRLHDPSGGRVTVGGVDARTVRVAELRRAVGLVSQSVFLFSGTVRENVVYGRRDASDEEVRAALAAAEADFVEELPGGLDADLGDLGRKLSGGQRQRLSIARALLVDPPVLVLDEATSAVDNETEAAIQHSIARASRNRTTLVIAHRLSTIRHADTIVVLYRGELVEHGSHDDLVEAGGLYARLWAVQTGAEGLDRGQRGADVLPSPT